MIVEIDDKEWGDGNYEYDVSINGGKITFEKIKYAEMKFETNEGDTVQIYAKNTVLSCKYVWAYFFLYWIGSLLSGTGERNPFGKPFDAYIQFKTNSGYVKLKANKICREKAFEVVDGNIEASVNKFVSSKKARRRWLLGMILPINIVGILIALMFICICINAVMCAWFFGILFAVTVVFIICWNIYACKILGSLKMKFEEHL